MNGDERMLELGRYAVFHLMMGRLICSTRNMTAFANCVSRRQNGFAVLVH